MDKKLNIAVISLGFLGDTLLTEPMCANIKKEFPNSKIIYIVTDIFSDIPKGFRSVDEVCGYSKKGRHKGLFGYFNFKKDFKYNNNIDYAIITHPHERSIILSKVIGAKNIISLPAKKSLLNIFINKKRKYIEDEIRTTYKADYNNGYLKTLCNYQNYPVQYVREDLNDEEIMNKFNLEKGYIVFSPTSKDEVKDWDYENIKNFIKNSPKKVVLIGTGKANEVAKQLNNDNVEFIDLTLKTTIEELGVVIKNSDCSVSVDTGTLHFSYAQNVKTIALFFNNKMITEWTPANNMYLKIAEGKKHLTKDKKVICEKNISYADVLELI